MRIVIPMSPTDRPLLEPFFKAFTHYGGYEQHPILLVPSVTMKGEAERYQDAIAKALGSSCPDIQVRALSDEFARYTWPVGPNIHFGEAAQLVSELPDAHPWLCVECDSVGHQPDWATKIALGFQAVGKNAMFFGKCIPADYRTKEGHPYNFDGDKVMLGTAVYPHDLVKLEHTKHAMFDLRVRRPKDQDGNGAPIEPFDWYLRTCFTLMGVSDTNLIEDQWNTVNFRMEDGELKCDAGPDRAEAPHARKRGGIISHESVFIHGCKDGSLHRLVYEGKIPKRTYVPAPPIYSGPVTLGVPVAQQNSDIQAAILEELRASREQNEKLLTLLLEKEKPSPLTTALHFAKTAVPTEAVLPQKEAVYVPMIDRIRDELERGHKSVKHLSDVTGLSRQEIRDLLTTNDDFIVGGPPGELVKLRQVEAAL